MKITPENVFIASGINTGLVDTGDIKFPVLVFRGHYPNSEGQGMIFVGLESESMLTDMMETLIGHDLWRMTDE